MATYYVDIDDSYNAGSRVTLPTSGPSESNPFDQDEFWDFYSGETILSTTVQDGDIFYIKGFQSNLITGGSGANNYIVAPDAEDLVLRSWEPETNGPWQIDQGDNPSVVYIRDDVQDLVWDFLLYQGIELSNNIGLYKNCYFTVKSSYYNYYSNVEISISNSTITFIGCTFSESTDHGNPLKIYWVGAPTCVINFDSCVFNNCEFELYVDETNFTNCVSNGSSADLIVGSFSTINFDQNTIDNFNTNFLDSFPDNVESKLVQSDLNYYNFLSELPISTSAQSISGFGGTERTGPGAFWFIPPTEYYVDIDDSYNAGSRVTLPTSGPSESNPFDFHEFYEFYGGGEILSTYIETNDIFYIKGFATDGIATYYGYNNIATPPTSATNLKCLPWEPDVNGPWQIDPAVIGTALDMRGTFRDCIYDFSIDELNRGGGPSLGLMQNFNQSTYQDVFRYENCFFGMKHGYFDNWTILGTDIDAGYTSANTFNFVGCTFANTNHTGFPAGWFDSFRVILRSSDISAVKLTFNFYSCVFSETTFPYITNNGSTIEINFYNCVTDVGTVEELCYPTTIIENPVTNTSAGTINVDSFTSANLGTVFNSDFPDDLDTKIVQSDLIYSDFLPSLEVDSEATNVSGFGGTDRDGPGAFWFVSGDTSATVGVSSIDVIGSLNQPTITAEYMKDYINGRLINLTKFLPIYLGGSDIETFVDIFEDQLNELYSGQVVKTSATEI
jgi:hypothetical protein